LPAKHDDGTLFVNEPTRRSFAGGRDGFKHIDYKELALREAIRDSRKGD